MVGAKKIAILLLRWAPGKGKVIMAAEIKVGERRTTSKSERASDREKEKGERVELKLLLRECPGMKDEEQ